MSEDTGSTSVESTSSAPESSEGSSDEIQELEQSIVEAPQPKTYRVKVDGQEVDVSEDELLSGYQTTKSAQQRFNEAARMRKQTEEFVRILKTDPRRVLEHPDIGLDLKTFARDYLAEQLEEEMLSPQEKELKSTKQKLAEYERAQRQQEEALRASEVEKYTRHYEEEYTTGIIKALDTSGLPKNEATVGSIAKYMKLALENGLDVTPLDVVHFVKRDYVAQIQSLFGAASEDTIMDLLGDQIGTKVVKGHLNKVKKGKTIPSVSQATVPSAGSERQEKTKALTKDEWRAEIQRRARG